MNLNQCFQFMDEVSDRSRLSFSGKANFLILLLQYLATVSLPIYGFLMSSLFQAGIASALL